MVEYLWKHKTLLNLPQKKSTRLRVGESKFWRKGDTLCISFQEKKSQTKPVLLLSTTHNAEVQEQIKRDKTKRKPSCIFEYNKYMRGVDMSDKQLYHHVAERSASRYWKRIFQNLLDISILNSWIIFKLQREKKMSRDKIILNIVESLCSFNPQPVPPRQLALPEPACMYTSIPSEKDCFDAVIEARTRRAAKEERGPDTGAQTVRWAATPHVLRSQNSSERGKGLMYTLFMSVSNLYFVLSTEHAYFTVLPQRKKSTKMFHFHVLFPKI